MSSISVKYFAILVFLIFGFVNFISCGAQFYKLSLTEDMQPAPKNDSGGVPLESIYGIHAIEGWGGEIPIKFSTSKELNAQQLVGLTNAMHIWELTVGKQLFLYNGQDVRDGNNFQDLDSSLKDTMNGFYLDDNWLKDGKSTLVLATTIWNNNPKDPNIITTADIRFNSQYYLIGDSLSNIPASAYGDPREVVDMESLALHELGHFLGLTHIPTSDDPHSVMNPSIYIGAGLSNRTLSINDIKRIQTIYGCVGENCEPEQLYGEIITLSHATTQNAPTATSLTPTPKKH